MRINDLMMPFIAAFVFWSVLHSLTASAGFKIMVSSWVGQRPFDGLYRLAYNGFSVITFLPVLLLLAELVPNEVIWRVPQPFNYLFVFIQLIGILGLIVSLFQTDLMRFAGLGQAARFLRGEEEVNPPPTLVTQGTYAYVRHPLYFFSLLVIWFLPIMTWGAFLFCVLSTIYFWVGSMLEERRLISTFGEEYRRYKQRVPRILPVKIFT
jgi:protein-S-isoprenylcysteine O-methyltransferase Ste14